jgi:hypothetical protein
VDPLHLEPVGLDPRDRLVVLGDQLAPVLPQELLTALALLAPSVPLRLPSRLCRALRLADDAADLRRVLPRDREGLGIRSDLAEEDRQPREVGALLLVRDMRLVREQRVDGVARLQRLLVGENDLSELQG